MHSTRRTCASLLAALDVHPRVAVQILRHSRIAVTVNVYTETYGADTLRALHRLGDAFERCWNRANMRLTWVEPIRPGWS